MNIKIYQDTRFRIECESAFIDINGIKWEAGVSIDMYPSLHYLELREKEGFIRMFVFKSKRHKKDSDLGWWTDAKVIWSMNKKHKNERK